MDATELQQRLAAVKELTELFKTERMVYLAVTIIALSMLLITAASLILKGISLAELGLLFGSSGLLTFVTTRLLYMWNEALKVLNPPEKSGD